MFIPCCVAALACALADPPVETPPEAPTYDPLAVPRTGGLKPVDFVVRDADRDRKIPLRVRLPEDTKPAPVILFSHGLGGDRAAGTYLAEHWAARGYVVATLQHPGSDDGVWKDVRLGRRMAAMKQAASGENLMLRVADVHQTLDQLKTWNAEADHPLFGRLNLDRVGMSGHSFGAVTTQHVSGQSAGIGFRRRETPRNLDPRIDAALALSPNVPNFGSPKKAFESVSIPWLLMTGTKDGGMNLSSATPESRQQVFPNLPTTIDRYQLVLKDAEHHAFADARRAFGQRTRNPNHHRAIRALSTAFWDAHLQDDPAAKAWLQGEEAKSVLEDGDEWAARRANN